MIITFSYHRKNIFGIIKQYSKIVYSLKDSDKFFAKLSADKKVIFVSKVIFTDENVIFAERFRRNENGLEPGELSNIYRFQY
jgi:hypothetical protein